MTAPGLYCAICTTLLEPGGDTVRLQEWNEWAQLTFSIHSHADDKTLALAGAAPAPALPASPQGQR